MAKAGDVIENPVRGERIVFRETARESRGRVLRLDVHVRPRSRGAGGMHCHPNAEERFRVINGTIRVNVGGRQRDLSAGEAVVVPAGVAHTFWNPHDEEAHVAVEVRPALRLETLAENDFGLVRDGRGTAAGDMKLLQAAVTLMEFAPELTVPQWYARWLLRLLAPFGRLLGYKPYYDQYGVPPIVDPPDPE